LIVGEPGPQSSAAHALKWALFEALNRLVGHEAGVRSGADPEDVHQARVATRRFRVILRQFRDLCTTQWADALRNDVKGLSDQLGAVRDADVLLARLRPRVEGLRVEDRAAGRALLDRLSAARSNHRDRLVRTIVSPKYQQLRDAMQDAVRRPQLIDLAEGPATDVLLPFARRTWRRVKTGVEDLGRGPSDRELHRVRIATKRARYTANVLVPVVGGRATRFAKAAARLQDVLGDHQDAVVSQEWLRRTAADASPIEAFVAGQLVVSERAEAAELRTKWLEAWDSLARPSLTKWLKG
jgi:CHAD domain-containing protein